MSLCIKQVIVNLLKMYGRGCVMQQMDIPFFRRKYFDSLNCLYFVELVHVCYDKH